MTSWRILFGRLLGTLFLLIIGLILVVRFGQLDAVPEPTLGHYPGGGELAVNYPNYLGAKLELYGRVVSTDPIILQGTYAGTELTLRIIGVTTNPTVGQYLHVFGVVEQDRTIRAVNSVVYPADGIWYTYVVSLFALAWTVSRFLNRWQISLDSLAFAPRQRPCYRILAKRRIDWWLGGE